MVCGGDLFVRALKREGVKHIFTLSGGHTAPIYNACYDEGIEIITDEYPRDLESLIIDH